MGLVMSGFTFSQNTDTLTVDSVRVVEQVKTITSTQCTGITKANARCKLKTRHESGQCHHHRHKDLLIEPQASCPSVQDISWVLDDDGKKYVVSLTDSEIYSDELDNSIKRDTFYVDTKHLRGALLVEDEWEDSCMNCDEVD